MASTGSITRTSSPTRQAILLQDRLACMDARQRTLAAYDVTLATISCKLPRPLLATCPRPLRRQSEPKLDLPATPTASSVAANPVLARTDGNWQECFILPRRLYRPHSSRPGHGRHPWTGPGALTSSISARSAALSVILPAAVFCTTCSALVAPPTTTGDPLELVI